MYISAGVNEMHNNLQAYRYASLQSEYTFKMAAATIVDAQ